MTVACMTLMAIFLTGCGAGKEVRLTEEMPTPDFEHDTPVGEITSDASVDQTFTSNCDEITGLELYGATYKRTNSGTVDITIYTCSEDDIRALDKNQLTEVVKWSLDASEFEDNTLITLDLGNAETFTDEKGKTTNRDLNGKKCLIQISSPDGVAGSCVTFWTTQNDEYDDGCLRLGEYEQYNDLWFQVIGNR